LGCQNASIQTAQKAALDWSRISRFVGGGIFKEAFELYSETPESYFLLAKSV